MKKESVPVNRLTLRCGLFLEYPKLSTYSIMERIMLNQRLLDILACPKCKGDLEYDVKDEKLICHSCRLKYSIREDIPIMLIDEAEKF
jgi:uncharacterized protein